jgi:hypothetical protein
VIKKYIKCFFVFMGVLDPLSVSFNGYPAEEYHKLGYKDGVR